MARQEQIIKISIETSQAKGAVRDLDKDLDKTQKSAKKTGKGLSAAFAGLKTSVLGAIPALNGLKVALISTGVGALVVAIGSLVGLFAKAANKGAEFQKSLSALKAVSGATAEDMGALSDQAKELGASTAFTAVQVVELQTELAKLGFSVSDIQNSTPAILDLAASLEVDLAEAAAFAGSTVRAFGLTTEETQRVVDVMSKSTASSALDFASLTESIKLAAPTAKALGVSVERTTALLGALADTGLKGSIAGTGLSKTFIELNKKGLTLDEAMEKVRNSSNGLNTAIDLVGVVGSKSLLNLASSGEKIAGLEESFNNAEGAAKNLAETRLDNLEGDMTKLGSAWEGFLLGVEDGEGPINKLQRLIIQGLTKAISNLGVVVDFIAFAFVDKWENAKMQFNGTVEGYKGLFTIFGAKIKKFANEALLTISKIPLIGEAIDKEAAQRRINEANEQLLNGQKQLQSGVDKLQQVALNKATFFSRFKAQQEGKAERIEKQRQAKLDQEQQQQLDDEKQKRDEEAAKKREEQIKKDREKLRKLEEKFTKADEDLQDKTNEEKAKRQRERALKELEALKLSETEKREAKKKINDYYDQVEKDAKAKDDEEQKAKDEKTAKENFEKLQIKKETEGLNFEEQRNLINERRALLLEDETLSADQRAELLKQYADAEDQLEEQKLAKKQQTLDGIIAIAGAESGVGKAMLIAKQLLNAREMLMEAKKTITFSKVAVAKSAVATAEGTAQTAKIGFPQNIPMLISYAAQAAGIISAIKSAASAASSAAGGGGVGGSTPAVPTGGAATPPSFNVVGNTGTSQLAEAIGGQTQQPVQAYVVANDITTAQSLENNIVEGATF